jgi:ketosteroid isomerase-like protein
MMTRFSLPLRFCALMLFLLAGSTVAVADEAADHEALRALVGEYEKAIAEANPAILEPYLAEDFSGVMVTGEGVDGMESLQAYWNKIQGMMGEGGKYTVEVVVPQPATIVGDLAYAHGTTKDRVVTGDGELYDFQGFWTAVCRKEGEQWKIVRIHGSMDSVGNTFVRKAVSTASLWSGLMGGGIGVVLGLVAGLVIPRRRATASNAP